MTRPDSSIYKIKVVKVGNYSFTGKVLGKGSFSVVQEAVHKKLKVKVSVKIIDLVKCHPYTVKNLWREATILHQLDHPNIMRVFEAMKSEEKYFLVTELMEGGDLCSFVAQQRGKPMVEVVARRFSRQIVSALSYMHEKNIVHRDLKLENIMLDSRKENIKLVDFGLSNRWTAESPLKTMCGSPEYSAPELFISNTHYGPEVDMWALGVIMYTMTVGKFPFPYQPYVVRGEKKISQFYMTISNGLSEAHIARIGHYSSDFVSLLNGLLNPKREERLKVWEVLKNPWISNKCHWAPLDHGRLNLYDLQKVYSKVCRQLDISEKELKTELSKNPFGDIAGHYNIVLYNQKDFKEEKTTSPIREEFNKLSPICHRKTHQERQEITGSNKVCIIGGALKINEATSTRKPLRRGIYTCSTSSSANKTRCNPDRNIVSNGDIQSAKGDWIILSCKEPPTVKKTVSPIIKTPKYSSSDRSTSTCSKFKKNHPELCNPILPTKMKLTQYTH